MPNYLVTEAAPTTNYYVRSGRGGAGNVVRASQAPKTTSHTVSSNAAVSRRFFSGIGGAGNVHQANERPALAIEEEYERAAARDQATVGHCGIGGAGNVFHRQGRKGSDASSVASTSSTLSEKSKIWARVSGTFSRN